MKQVKRRDFSPSLATCGGGHTIKRGLWLLALPALLSVALADDIQKETQRTQAEFQALDRDSDQRISKSEARRDDHLKQRFAAVDADADGYVSADEFMARPNGKRFE